MVAALLRAAAGDRVGRGAASGPSSGTIAWVSSPRRYCGARRRRDRPRPGRARQPGTSSRPPRQPATVTFRDHVVDVDVPRVVPPSIDLDYLAGDRGIALVKESASIGVRGDSAGGAGRSGEDPPRPSGHPEPRCLPPASPIRASCGVRVGPSSWPRSSVSSEFLGFVGGLGFFDTSRRARRPGRDQRALSTVSLLTAAILIAAATAVDASPHGHDRDRRAVPDLGLRRPRGQ